MFVEMNTSSVAESLAKNRITYENINHLTLENIIVELDGTCLFNEFCITEKCVCQSPYRTREVGVKRLLIPNLFVESKCDSGDIALLELMEEVNYRKIHLARPNTPLPSNKILYASGYGYDPERKILTDMDELKTVEVNVLAKCPKYLEREDDAICADEVVLDQNVCEGDSGASLKDIENDTTIFGVVSFGSLCDEMLNDDLRALPIEERKYKNAEVYTNITYYLPFICGIIGLNESIGCLIEDIKRAKKQPYFEIKRSGKISKNAPEFVADIFFGLDDFKK
uniref:Peptidase S1 domain-containing protein n=1 Tax=Meloidogyne enterolobii TaxID=390850 RepID=A0A6V7VGH4_MELEN|nr:unnamed protein product [Meloidogyne enterolobii]